MAFATRVFVLLLVAAPHSVKLKAQESCGVEAKLLLVPAQTEEALRLLHATGERRTRIYFYDTPSLDLLAKGLILRLRVGANGDLTVKLRPLNGKNFSGSSGRGETYKCEVEITGGVEGRSYSVATRSRTSQVPESGMDLARLLSPGQKK